MSNVACYDRVDSDSSDHIESCSDGVNRIRRLFAVVKVMESRTQFTVALYECTWIFLQVNTTLSKLCGKVCVMMFSRSSVGRRVSSMEVVVEVGVEKGALARLAGEY